VDELIQRYLDGELSMEEARQLREAIARDPRVEAELRAWEGLLKAAADADPRAPSAGFTAGVMRRVQPPRKLGLEMIRSLLAVSWPARVAWAATLVVMFALGAWVARDADRGRAPRPGTLVAQEVAPSGAAAASTQDDMRVVRLVYVPRDPAVREVHVAGTFNEWDPRDITLERKGRVWTTVLVLPRGSYEYMFVENDGRWVTDPLATQTRDDGFGRRNAVLDLSL